MLKWDQFISGTWHVENFIYKESLELPKPLLSLLKRFVGVIVLGRALVKIQLSLTMEFFSQFSKLNTVPPE